MRVTEMTRSLVPPQSMTPQARFSHILIVEDDAAQLRTLTKIMAAEGFQVVGCQLANEALQLLSHTFFGVIIIDAVS